MLLITIFTNGISHSAGRTTAVIKKWETFAFWVLSVLPHALITKEKCLGIFSSNQLKMAWSSQENSDPELNSPKEDIENALQTAWRIVILTCLMAKAPSLSSVSSAKWTPNSASNKVNYGFNWILKSSLNICWTLLALWMCLSYCTLKNNFILPLMQS